VISRRTFLKTLGGGFAALMSLGAYAVAEPTLRLRVQRYALTPPGWTPGLRLRVALLADLHACEPWMRVERIAAICDAANALEPDIVLLLGDYVSGMRIMTAHIPQDVWARELAKLRAPLGVHAVLGNHDWWEDRDAQRQGGGMPAAGRALQGVGIPVYSNRAVRLEKEGQAFWLAGIEDQRALIGRRGGTGPTGLDDLPATLRQVHDNAPVILMAHEPDIFPDVPSRVSLTLSGHTHGGQVRLLGFAPTVPSRYGGRYAYGHIEEGGGHLIVSGGLGCSSLPIRFGVPPEINLIELG
jgi:predicted MPP superfamily phosphohydrolase